jgi:hypothetical protein
VELSTLSNGVIMCIGNAAYTVPAGYVVTALLSSQAGCGANNGLGYNAVELSAA